MLAVSLANAAAIRDALGQEKADMVPEDPLQVQGKPQILHSGFHLHSKDHVLFHKSDDLL